MKVKVYNLKREEVGDLELDDQVFGTDVKRHLLHEVVTAQRAGRRQGTQHNKERSAVAGTNKKLFKQKGTGNARQGGARAPHRRGGGVAHHMEGRDYSYRPPRKVRLGALKSALSLFAAEGRLVVVEKIELADKKTKAMAGHLGALKVEKSLVVDSADNENLILSMRNLPNHNYLPPEGVNVYDLLRHKQLVVSKDAAKALEARLLK